MRPISARSRSLTMESILIESRSARAWSALRTGVLPRCTTYFGPRTEAAGFRYDLAGHQKVEKHSDGREVLLHGRRGALMVLDICRHHDRSDLFGGTHAMLLAPREKLPDGLAVGGASILFRIVAVKNSMNRLAARSPARTITPGKLSRPARVSSRFGIGMRPEFMPGEILGLRAARRTPPDRRNPLDQSLQR